jgi:hypothetical protein
MIVTIVTAIALRLPVIGKAKDDVGKQAERRLIRPT